MIPTQLRHLIGTAAVLLSAITAPTAPLLAQNIAQGKQAFQSSTFAFGQAEKAVDGNTDGVFNNGSVSHTNGDAQAWWYVDLGGTFSITGITVWNRTDGFGERLSNFNVSVLADGVVNVGNILTPTVWTQFFAGAAGVTTPFTPTANTSGRYVKVQLTGTDFLQLAEVQVNGSTISTVPEPATTALLAVGLAGLAATARRRRTTA